MEEEEEDFESLLSSTTEAAVGGEVSQETAPLRRGRGSTGVAELDEIDLFLGGSPLPTPSGGEGGDEVTEEELLLLGEEVEEEPKEVTNGNEVTNSNKVTNSNQVTNSDEVTNSNQVVNSDEVANSNQVTNSNKVANSKEVVNSKAVTNSDDVKIKDELINIAGEELTETFEEIMSHNLNKVSNITNITGKGETVEELDYSLLEPEGWEEEWQLRETTVAALLSELDEQKLLDSSEEEEETQVVSQESSVAKPRKRRKRIEKDSIEREYYRQLKEVWAKYSSSPGVGLCPLFGDVRKPRIFHDKKNNEFDFESVEEYIDSLHPLWGSYKKLFREVLEEEREQGARLLARQVHLSWGGRLKEGRCWGVDTTQNLTAFSRPSSRKDRHTSGARAAVLDKMHKLNLSPGIKAALEEMYEQACRPGVQEAEEARFKRFEAEINSLSQVSAETVQAESVDCSFCLGTCLCSPGKGRRGIKRKKEEMVDRVEVMGLVSREEMMDKARASARELGVEAAGGLLLGVTESYSLHSHYRGQGLSQLQAQELLSLEKVQGMFATYYSSPYTEEQPQGEEEGWSSELLQDY